MAASCPHISPLVHEHVDVLGVKVSAVNMDSAVKLAIESIEIRDPAYVCAASVHGVMEAQRDPGLLRIFNQAAINIPDGMPLTWVGWLQGFAQMDRVFGPDFMLQMCRISVSRGYRHFLYGGNPGVADELSERLQKMFPGLQIAGTYTPPFRSLNPEEERDVVERTSRAKPHILWVGIGAPKQERFMAEYVGRFSVPLMVGVGAAFDFHTGRIADCPEWVKRAGLQWLHRLKQEPGRLWKRYLVNNPVFLWRVAWQLIRRSCPRRTAVDRPSRATERSARKSADLKT
jgi:N-acetylglucosaminyldiphosphoundecaprenol N-acetyl-beta-D-mannosaminyltransferase